MHNLLPSLFAGPVETLSQGHGFVLAYLDPGTGSFVFQLLIAGLFSGMYAVRHYWRSLRSAVLTSASRDD